MVTPLCPTHSKHSLLCSFRRLATVLIVAAVALTGSCLPLAEVGLGALAASAEARACDSLSPSPSADASAEARACDSLSPSPPADASAEARACDSLSPSPPADASAPLSDKSVFSLETYGGTVRTVLVIHNPEGLGTLHSYQSPGFRQKVISQTADTARIEIESTLALSIDVGFPLNVTALADEVRLALEPTDLVQSDDEGIVALATELTRSATHEAAAVEDILAWVRGNIRFDNTCTSQDAVSVLQSRCATDKGFANLSMALLQAAGIPSRSIRGCVAPQPVVGWRWTIAERGAWHTWIEVYYPDLGWVPSDPQRTVNWLDTAHIAGGFGECQWLNTTITTESHTENVHRVYSRRMPHTIDPLPPSLIAASRPALERKLLEVTPAQVVVVVAKSEPNTTLRLDIDDKTGEELEWSAESSASWLSPQEIVHTGSGRAVFDVDASELALGSYHTTLLVSTASPFPGQGDQEWKIPVTLYVVSRLEHQYLNMIFRYWRKAPDALRSRIDDGATPAAVGG